MNKEIYDVMMKIEQRLEELDKEELNVRYENIKEAWNKKIKEEEKKIFDSTTIELTFNDPKILKARYLIQLEEYLKYLYNSKFLLIEIRKTNNITKEKLDILKNMVDEDKTLTLDDYIDIKNFLKENDGKIQEVKEDKKQNYYKIKPKKKRFKKFISPKEFMEQFGFYPYENTIGSTNLVNYDISYINYSCTNLNGCCFKDTNFKFPLSNLKTKTISACNFENVDLSNQCFDGLDISKANLKNTGAKINPQTIYEKNLYGTNLSGLDLETANFNGVHLRNTDLSFTNAEIDLNKIHNGEVEECNFEGLDFSNLNIYRNITITGSNFKNTGLKLILKYISEDNNGKNLKNCDLTGCVIIGELFQCNLINTILPANNNYIIDGSTCELSGIVSNGAIIKGDLNWRWLNNCKIKDSRAYINPQNVLNKDLSNGDYRGCIFFHTNFDGINIEGSLFDPEIKEIIDGQRQIIKHI